MRATIWPVLAAVIVIGCVTGCSVRRETRALIAPTYSYLQPSPSLDQQPREAAPIGSVASLERPDQR